MKDAVPFISRYFSQLSDRQLEQFRALGPLYRAWNQKINVISRKDIGNLYEHHILHSLAIAKVIAFQPGTSILDVGTGGGFPGLPLAVTFPESRFHLVDSKKKKLKVVEEVARELTLSNIRTEQLRIGEHDTTHFHERFDFFTSRATASLKELYHWCAPYIRSKHRHQLKNGGLVLKGGALEAEIKALGREVQQIAIGSFLDESYFEKKWVLHLPVNG